MEKDKGGGARRRRFLAWSNENDSGQESLTPDQKEKKTYPPFVMFNIVEEEPEKKKKKKEENKEKEEEEKKEEEYKEEEEKKEEEYKEEGDKRAKKDKAKQETIIQDIEPKPPFSCHTEEFNWHQFEDSQLARMMYSRAADKAQNDSHQKHNRKNAHTAHSPGACDHPNFIADGPTHQEGAMMKKDDDVKLQDVNEDDCVSDVNIRGFCNSLKKRWCCNPKLKAKDEQDILRAHVAKSDDTSMQIPEEEEEGVVKTRKLKWVDEIEERQVREEEAKTAAMLPLKKGMKSAVWDAILKMLLNDSFLENCDLGSSSDSSVSSTEDKVLCVHALNEFIFEPVDEAAGEVKDAAGEVKEAAGEVMGAVGGSMEPVYTEDLPSPVFLQFKLDGDLAVEWTAKSKVMQRTRKHSEHCENRFQISNIHTLSSGDDKQLEGPQDIKVDVVARDKEEVEEEIEEMEADEEMEYLLGELEIQPELEVMRKEVDLQKTGEDAKERSEQVDVVARDKEKVEEEIEVEADEEMEHSWGELEILPELEVNLQKTGEDTKEREKNEVEAAAQIKTEDDPEERTVTCFNIRSMFNCIQNLFRRGNPHRGAETDVQKENRVKHSRGFWGLRRPSSVTPSL